MRFERRQRATYKRNLREIGLEEKKESTIARVRNFSTVSIFFGLWRKEGKYCCTRKRGGQMYFFTTLHQSRKNKEKKRWVEVCIRCKRRMSHKKTDVKEKEYLENFLWKEG